MIIFNSSQIAQIRQILIKNKIPAKMGIDGLLNLMKPVIQKQHISTFRDLTIGVDAMPWIYKGCYSCTYQLTQDIQSVNFLYYLLQMIDMLDYYNIKPIFVFDGRSLPHKKDTLDKRNKTKQENKKKGLQCLKNNDLQSAKRYLSRCIQIDERILALTMRCLKTKNIQFIVAPYEADTQLAKLKRLGIIDAAISEDSDMLIYGLNVLFKLNQNGQCDYIDLSKWEPKSVDNQFLSLFLSFPTELRIDSAVLAGCDYLPSIKGIGIKRAIKLLSKHQNTNEVISKLRKQAVYAEKIAENYEDSVEKVKLIFNLATTYNINQGKLQPLNPDDFSKFQSQDRPRQQILKIVGEHYEYSQSLSRGQMNSKTLQKRQLQPLNFRQVFAINKQNLIMHQSLNKKRREDEEILRLQKSQQKQKGPTEEINEVQEQDKNGKKKKTKKKIVIEKPPLSQDQIKQRKEERKNRIVRLQNMMNATIGLFDDIEQDEKQSQSKVSSIENFQNSVGQASISFGVLNPFQKKQTLSHLQKIVFEGIGNIVDEASINNPQSNKKNIEKVEKSEKNEKSEKIQPQEENEQDAEEFDKYEPNFENLVESNQNAIYDEQSH